MEEWLVWVVLALYDDAVAQIRVDGELSEEFQVGVGLHQGSTLSPLLFNPVLEALSRNFRQGLPNKILAICR